MIKILFFSFFILSSCSSIKKIEKSKQVKTETVKDAPKLTPVEVQNVQIRPGEVAKIKFKFPVEIKKIKCSDNEISIYKEDDHYAAFIVESYFSKLQPFSCFANNIAVAHFTVESKDFPSETLNVDMKRVSLSKADQKRVQQEQIFLNSTYRGSPEYPLFTSAFELPIYSELTSIYGSRRVFNKKKQTQHLGTDFRAAVGEPIKSANAGRVVVARDLFFTGNTVTIDHGLGIFTIYGHLSKIKTVEGEMIPQGAVIGLAGATGRVTGPHLHWGVKIEGEFVDGHSLVEASK